LRHGRHHDGACRDGAHHGSIPFAPIRRHKLASFHLLALLRKPLAVHRNMQQARRNMTPARRHLRPELTRYGIVNIELAVTLILQFVILPSNFPES
jgi:hypothetical protein